MHKEPSKGAWLNFIPVVNMYHLGELLKQATKTQRDANAAYEEKLGVLYETPRRDGLDFTFARHFNHYSAKNDPAYNAALRADVAHYEARNNFLTSAGGTFAALGLVRLGEVLAQAREPHAAIAAVASAAVIGVASGALSSQQRTSVYWGIRFGIPKKLSETFWKLPFIRSYDKGDSPNPVQGLGLHR